MLFKNKEQDPYDFEPELLLYHIKGLNGSDDFITAQINSGDLLNQNKNLKISAKDIASISLEVETDDELIDQQDINVKTIQSKASLIITRLNSKEIEKHHLCDHQIEIYGTKLKKHHDFSWPSVAEIKLEINAIWQDEFGLALDEYNDCFKGITPKNRPSEDRASKKDSIISLGCIIIVLICAAIIANKFLFNSTPPHSLSKEVVNMINSEAYKNEPNANAYNSSEISAEDEALAEFGLEAGVNLDK